MQPITGGPAIANTGKDDVAHMARYDETKDLSLRLGFVQCLLSLPAWDLFRAHWLASQMTPQSDGMRSWDPLLTQIAMHADHTNISPVS